MEEKVRPAGFPVSLVDGYVAVEGLLKGRELWLIVGVSHC